MCPSRQVPASDDPAAAVANALDALGILRRGRGAPGGPGPLGRGGPGRHGWPPRAAREHDASDHAHEHEHGRDAHEPHDRGPGGRGRMMAVHRALTVLSAAEQPMSITDLGAAIGIDQPRASRVVQMLQGEGLVRREADPSDARRTRIAVTAAGRSRADAHRERRAAPVAEALAALDEAEREQLAVLLSRLVDAWPRA